MKNYLLIAALCYTPAFAASTIDAVAVRVIDGDTIEVLDEAEQSARIRLGGIDAPESTQPLGDVSTQALQACVDSGAVIVEYDKTDKYGRFVGKVLADGKDCNLAQIQKGMAWHYKKYENEQSATDRLDYAAAEIAAKADNLGVWAQACNINPSDWRRGKRCDTATAPAAQSKKVGAPAATTAPVSLTTKPAAQSCAKKTCKQIKTCAEAKYLLNVCGYSALDRDKDGVPCESICR